MPLVQFAPGVAHVLVALVFDILILAMFAWMLLSWIMPMMPGAQGHPLVRFLDAIIAPLTDPIRKRIPSASLGMLNISYSVAFIFAWWSLRVLAGVIMQALPYGW